MWLYKPAGREDKTHSERRYRSRRSTNLEGHYQTQHPETSLGEQREKRVGTAARGAQISSNTGRIGRGYPNIDATQTSISTADAKQSAY
jgi:hypothetical protein